jgi:hypothetical protein
MREHLHDSPGKLDAAVCSHPPERLEKTFGLRRLPCCLDCFRQMCHLCLRVHTGPCVEEQAARLALGAERRRKGA